MVRGKFAQPSRVSKYYERGECRSRFDFRKLATLLIAFFLRELTFLSQMSAFSRNLNHRWKIEEQKKDFPGHNILELYND